MIKTMGLTKDDIKLFLSMLGKANTGQIMVMTDALAHELKKRLEDSK